MGLPGSGKTTLSVSLIKLLSKDSYSVDWFNADEVRGMYNDWDFTKEGRIRQAHRMRELADKSRTDFCIADFVAPYPISREIYDADFTIWVDTIKTSGYEDTNAEFVEPDHYDFRITQQDHAMWSNIIYSKIV